MENTTHTPEELKQLLIKALEEERDRMVSLLNVRDHNLAITYLKTGTVGVSNPEDWEMLDGVVNDYDQMVSDYVLNPPTH